MSTLYVDVDDTLICEDTEATQRGELGFAWGMNYPKIHVVAAVQWHFSMLGHGRHTVIWSGGGKDYADRWRRLLFPGLPFEGAAKDRDRLAAGDVVVDDGLEFVVPEGVRLYLPMEFVEWVDGQ